MEGVNTPYLSARYFIILSDSYIATPVFGSTCIKVLKAYQHPNIVLSNFLIVKLELIHGQSNMRKFSFFSIPLLIFLSIHDETNANKKFLFP